MLETGSFGRWLGKEGGTLIGGMTVLKETPKSSLIPSSIRTRQEDGCPWSRKWVFTCYWMCRSHDLGCAASTTVKNKRVVFKSPPVWDAVVAARTDGHRSILLSVRTAHAERNEWCPEMQSAGRLRDKTKTLIEDYSFLTQSLVKLFYLKKFLVIDNIL